MKGRGDIRAGITVFAVTERGLELSGRLLKALEGVTVVPPRELKGGGLKKKAATAFRGSSALVFISAMGIAVRAIAPHIKGKRLDPAVVVVDERARFSISLLSGHAGGANRLAEKIAGALGSTPVITTATDLWGLPCAEYMAGEFSLAIENPGMIKAVNSAVLNGKAVHIVDADASRLGGLRDRFGEESFRYGPGMPARLGEGEAVVLISGGREKVPKGCGLSTLVLRPRELVAGIGCCRGVAKKDLKKALALALRKAGFSMRSIRGFATIDIKKGEKGLEALAEELGVGIEYYGSERLNRVKSPSPPSRFVEEITGTGGVAEPAALLASGARELCLRKMKCGRVTVALARAPFAL